MGKIYMAALAIIMVTGCAYNSRVTEITIYSGKNTSIDAEGATNTTDTGQMPQADLTPLVEAAQAAIGGMADAVVDKLTGGLTDVSSVIEDIGDDDSATVDQGSVEVIE